jgi:hypothetical protein
VVAALFALGSLVFAGKPADNEHPYGHGKIEYFSAVFEEGLIAFAAVGSLVLRRRAHPRRNRKDRNRPAAHGRCRARQRRARLVSPDRPSR